MSRKISNAELKGIHAGVSLVFEDVCHALLKPDVEDCLQTGDVARTDDFSTIGADAGVAYHPELVSFDSSMTGVQSVEKEGFLG